LEFQKAKFNERNFVFLVLLISGSLNSLSFVFLLNKLLVLNTSFNLFENISFRTINNFYSYLSASQNLLLLFFPQILFREHVIPAKAMPRNKETGSLEDSSLSQERLLEIDQIIQDYILEQVYLTKGFNVTRMTLDTGIPSHQISLYFKDFLHCNFNDWKIN